MNTIVDEKLISFKELEQKIFTYVCELARDMTQIILESYDNELASARDRTKYRDKGKRSTTIKTVYGEVEYQRRVYQTLHEIPYTAGTYALATCTVYNVRCNAIRRFRYCHCYFFCKVC